VVEAEKKNILSELEESQAKLEEAIQQASRSYEVHVKTTSHHNN